MTPEQCYDVQAKLISQFIILLDNRKSKFIKTRLVINKVEEDAENGK